MAMSKKDYVAVAAAVKKEVDIAAVLINKGHRMDALRGVAVNMAGVFAKDNPRFDMGRFLAACGVI